MNFKLLTAICAITVTTLTAKGQDLPLDPAVRTGKLPNGFTYYIRHNENPGKRVIFYLANKFGSVVEKDDQRGLAHFMEHMSFNGTTHFPKNELINYLQKCGVRFGADLNAYTSFDETVYQLPMPADDPKIVAQGIMIMRDWAQEAMLDPAEIDKERGVILEEKRLKKGADERIRQLYFPHLLNNSIYARRLPIGSDDILKNFKPETLKSFYHDWYRPNLQAIIVVGDIDVNAMENAIKVRFGDLKNPVHEKTRTPYQVSLTGKSQFLAYTDPEKTSTDIEVIFKQPELPMHTASQYRESLVRELFNNMFSERLTELQRRGDVAFVKSSAGIGHFIGGIDSYTITVSPKPGDLQTGFKAIWREHERLKRFGFTERELERAKRSFMNQMESALKEKNKTSSESYVKEYLQYFLNGTSSPGIDAEHELARKYLPEVSSGDLNKLIRAQAKIADRDILITAPENEKSRLPKKETVDAWIHQVEKDQISPYEESDNTRPILSREPVPGKIVSEQLNPTLHIVTLTLSNGIRVLLKPTDFKNNQILFTGFSAGGTSLYSDADFQSANAANMIPSFGAGNYNATELSENLSARQISVRPFINERVQGISGSSSINDLQAALELSYAYLTEPRKDLLQFNGIISRSKASLVNRDQDPAKVYADTVNAVLGDYNVRRTGPNISKLDQISLDRAFYIYQERFADMGSMTFVFTGSIDTTTIKPLLEKYLGSLPDLKKHEQAQNLHLTTPAGTIQKTVFKGTEPRATVNLVFSGPFDFNIANDLKMDALQEVIAIRLNERLREEESGVYSPGVKVGTVKYPQARFNLNISFGCAPENVEKLIASVLDELDKVRVNGPLPLNLEKFKAENRRIMETQLQSNGFWLGYLSGQLQNDEPLEQLSNYNDLISKIAVADIKKLASKYLNCKNYIRLVLMPERSKL
ncbi:M16 family metallopeptidase [Mucilaginibacter aquaedulcis]|uniref:M16 family metallopeptidase n=1 Tax=Mucilaginibacter aquaedulcis TaxID=1187081 RepID=UPI0025B426BB|nr:M16 family metallopeptidase [Mucilaginibacter aquaedulcis]MDN3548837.1 insulinase family protein [Mucilaginibacter aquaedulcis]